MFPTAATAAARGPVLQRLAKGRVSIVRVATDVTDVVWSVGERDAGEASACGVFTGTWTSDPAGVDDGVKDGGR